MKYEISFTANAEEDLQISFKWYENESPGLGWEFRNEIALCIEKIKNDKVIYQAYISDIRKLSVSRFPYIIYYVKNEVAGQIVIGAVLHERRDPATIKRRLGL